MVSEKRLCSQFINIVSITFERKAAEVSQTLPLTPKQSRQINSTRAERNNVFVFF